jgi:hypothetical protein
MRFSKDWYDYDGKVRTNHSGATLKIRASGLTDLHVGFDTDFFNVPVLNPGQVTAFVNGNQTHGLAASGFLLFGQLDPNIVNDIVITTTIGPEFPLGIIVDRWRDESDTQGYFWDVSSIAVNSGAILLPVPDASGIVLVYGDSVVDSLIPMHSGTIAPLNPKGTLSSWPNKVFEDIDIINHSFGGWFGCGLEFPLAGFNSETELRDAVPQAHPTVPSMIDRNHVFSPTFFPRGTKPTVVFYTLGNNDGGTGRLNHGLRYVEDLVANFISIKSRWPDVKIVVCTTHTSGESADRQRTLANVAATQTQIDGLIFVDFTEELSLLGFNNVDLHPTEDIHSVMADIVRTKLLAECPEIFDGSTN